MTTEQLLKRSPQQMWTEQEQALADVLFAAWRAAEPEHSITQHPASFRATFLGLARAALRAQPNQSVLADLVEDLQSIDTSRAHQGHSGCGVCDKTLKRLLALVGTKADTPAAVPSAPVEAQQVTRTAVLEAAKRVGLIGWLSDDRLYFEWAESQAPSLRLVELVQQFALPAGPLTVNELEQLRADARRIDFMQANPNAIKRAQGYRGAASEWSYPAASGRSGCESLRDAIDAAEGVGRGTVPATGDRWQPIATAPRDGTEIILRRGGRVTSGAWIEWTKTAPEYHDATGAYLGQSEQDSGASWQSWDGGFTEEEPPEQWQPLPRADAEPQAHRCTSCKSVGFESSVTGQGCTFCDGTEGGQPPMKPASAPLSREQAEKCLPVSSLTGKTQVWFTKADVLQAIRNSEAMHGISAGASAPAAGQHTPSTPL